MLEQIISNFGLSMLGLASPQLAVDWTTGQAPQAEDAPANRLSLTSADNWRAPAAGILFEPNPAADRLITANGSPLRPDAVFRLHPQVHLRLVRLYATVIEGRTADTDRPMRPVPYFFAFTNTAGAVEPGHYAARDDLGISGTMTIHDERGLPIDPVAVAGTFDLLIEQYGVLEASHLLDGTPTDQAARQIHSIGQLGDGEARMHLVDPYGRPFDNDPANDGTSLLETLSDVDRGAGLYSVPGAVSDAINVASTAPPGLRVGPATFGTLDNSFSPAAAATEGLHRDFLRGMVVDLGPFLIGERAPGDAAEGVEERPRIRHNETIGFSFDGNAALGEANAILDGNSDKRLVVSPIIEEDFDLPADGTDDNAQWPSFPEALPATADPIPANLRDGFAPTAHFVDASPGNADVVLTLSGLTPGQALRVYNRRFLPDAREGRGDGAGAVVTAQSGQAAFLLADPLGLLPRGIDPATLADPTLHVDLVVVNTESQARVFGNVAVAVAPATSLTQDEGNLLPAEDNGLDTVPDRGIASAGILGLSPDDRLDLGNDTGPPSLQKIIETIVGLGDEGPQREASRFPTMARRDAMVASSSGGVWRGQLSGMHLVADARNARQRLGSPGAPGGRELQTVSVQTDNGLLAYDIALCALRRTRDIASRLVELSQPNDNGTPTADVGSEWQEPAAATDGTVSGAVLQTIAPATETPHLYLVRHVLSNLPDTWTALVSQVTDPIQALFQNIPQLDDLVEAMDDLENSPVGDRLYEELQRDFSASVHGRRDALWALRETIGAARDIIYVEGPAFTATDYGAPPADDLVTAIEDRLAAMPGLRLILCLSKELDYGLYTAFGDNSGYETFAAREYAKRKEAIERLMNAADGRVVAFHPIGFPGRPLRLMTNLTIIDDVWAMVGTSTIRRRGLTFDGGLDLVFFDREIEAGRSLQIANLRRNLMAGHLGTGPAANADLPDASWSRLADGHQAFEVFRELLDQGGAGLIEPLWDGRVPGAQTIAVTDFPSDDIADPEGRHFETSAAAIISAIKTTGAAP